MRPIHADRWFWEINKDYTPKKKKELNVGYHYGCDGNNGFEESSPVHKKQDMRYQYEFRDE